MNLLVIFLDWMSLKVEKKLCFLRSEAISKS
eukprot:CAMPEP_0176338694 /NCGR_PEP_ID=MMETSP0126-20121128/158_1 /TAXON_ID=141414 ORGANISM="Strombidinopsis acuminatum, Strain SPMC142" /NCGR_SAMPLE_ID=MMETSP0126 /ASSEMBLY_ACC=CAM_ASM_000229 /LENGTH=30 /DNA_ID= /DNA_START= /DNA_END= /DNA_ORIENTATION=